MIIFTRYIQNVSIAFFGLLKSIFNLKPLPFLYNLDLFANAVFFGDPQETISSRAGKLVLAGDRGLAYYLCRILHLFDAGHCRKNIQNHEGSDELIVLDRGFVIGSMVAIFFYTYPELFMAILEFVI